MGFFSKDETHESRSSSMSYVLRWSYKNARQIAIYALLAVAVISIFLAYILYQGKKSVQLMIDGKPVAVETRQQDVEGLLSEQNIELSSQDQITPALSTELKDGDQIVINRAEPVVVIADGTAAQKYTTADTVETALQESGITVSENDKVYPALDTAVTAHMKIHVVRVNKVMVKMTQAVPYTVVKTSDPNLLKGKTKTLQSGSNGQVVHTIEKVFQDGQLISKRWVSKTVAKTATSEVIAVGTKVEEPKTEVLAASITRKANTVSVSGTNSVTKNGVSFKYKKVLKNVSLTAYSSEESGIGTKTASGTRVTEGRTIAVDSDVIPLGWWVYIEGVGFRRAEDTGGAIKGNKIDVFYDTLKEANNFGRKKGRTVYVIGPVKPELN
ncbi:3D domain-containing protein [Paenibacillus pinistramenti]|uniref:3D domain-containing protein n=1 Tax=Paenibacillus pinistramenti TaxID=1768003 RepID=UPI0011080356|nr:3D domain-containing protein [Paenibacillus pinistramenti]